MKIGNRCNMKICFNPFKDYLRTFYILSVNVRFMFSLPLVPIPRVGHSHPRGQKPDQPDADDQPSQEDHCSRGPQAPMGLRKCPLLDRQADKLFVHIWSTLLGALNVNLKKADNVLFIFFFSLNIILYLSPSSSTHPTPLLPSLLPFLSNDPQWHL